jgi:1,4-dihydroxy-2-naphthoate octaprenyltransferase
MGVLLSILSGSSFIFNNFFLGYLIFFPDHLGLSYSNNYFDYKIDKYNDQNFISGGSKFLLNNKNLRKFTKWFAIILMIISISLSFIFTVFFNLSFIIIPFVIIGNLISWFYTAPPLKFAYRGFGEVATIISSGVLMPGMGYLIMKGGFDSFFYLFSIPLTLYGIDFIITVEIPDMEGDIKGNKKTIVVKKGRKNSYRYIFFSLLGASLYFSIIYFLGLFSNYLNFFPLFIFSLIPLVFSFFILYKSQIEKIIATKYAISNIAMLSIFMVLTNIYFVAIILF